MKKNCNNRFDWVDKTPLNLRQFKDKIPLMNLKMMISKSLKTMKLRQVSDNKF